MSLTTDTFDVMINNYRIQCIRQVNKTVRRHKEGLVTPPIAMIEIGNIMESYKGDVQSLIATMFEDEQEKQEAYSRYMNSLGF